MIRNIVCHDCRERISPAHIAQHKASFGSQTPLVLAEESHNVGIQTAPSVISPHTTTGAIVSPFLLPSGQTSFAQPQMSTFRPASPTPAPLPRSQANSIDSTMETFFTPPETPIADSLDEMLGIAGPAIEKSPWSVVYNNEIKQSLRVIFVHALKYTNKVYAVRFSQDGKFLASGVDRVGRTHLYDVKTMSMKAYVSTWIHLAECPSTLHLEPWLNILGTIKKNLVHITYNVCASPQMADI